MTWTALARLDALGTDLPGFAEGHPEDRCPLCEWPVVDHWPTYSSRRVPARWPHRRVAALAMVGDWLDRLIARAARLAHRR